MAETTKKYLDYEGLEHLIDTRIKNVSVAESSATKGGGTSVGNTLVLKYSGILAPVTATVPTNCEDKDVFVRAYYNSNFARLGFTSFNATDNQIRTAFINFDDFDGVNTTLASKPYVDSKTWDASDITSGTLDSARIPNLPASKITSGTLGVDRIPSLPTTKITSGAGPFASGVIPDLDASKITTGKFGVDRLPDLDASKITTGKFGVDRLPDLWRNDLCRSIQRRTDAHVINTSLDFRNIRGGRVRLTFYGAPASGSMNTYFGLMDKNGGKIITKSFPTNMANSPYLVEIPFSIEGGILYYRVYYMDRPTSSEYSLQQVSNFSSYFDISSVGVYVQKGVTGLDVVGELITTTQSCIMGW